jgi:hypothetical protein
MSAISPEMIYRVILDYEALQDGFADRIEDLNVPMTEVDAGGGLTRGNAQKLLVKSDAKWARQFGWESLGKMLKGTGLALALIVDDERFAPIKAEMAQRKTRERSKMLPPGSIRLLNGKITHKTSIKLQLLRNQKLSSRQRSRIAKLAARSRWSKRRKNGESGAVHAS